MKQIGLAIFFLAVVVLVLPSSHAQTEKKDPADKTDEKKDPAKKDDDKKDPAKKDDDKKDPAKKDDDKKDPAKKDDDKKDLKKKDYEEKKTAEPKKAPEKLVWAHVYKATKILSASGKTNREITIEIYEVDPNKVRDMQNWAAGQQQGLQRRIYDISVQKDFNARNQQMLDYQRAQYDYQMELTRRQANIYTAKPLDVRAADNVKVRSMGPPLEFDDQGFEKKWTKKELAALADKSGLPGYPTEIDALKQGQYVDVYMAKNVPPAKVAPKKKGPAADDPPAVSDRPEFVLLVIYAPKKK
jgi:hypothetical protein